MKLIDEMNGSNTLHSKKLKDLFSVLSFLGMSRMKRPVPHSVLLNYLFCHVLVNGGSYFFYFFHEIKFVATILVFCLSLIGFA
jgi:hypothetical protein